jgi:hypothetical protein
MPATASITTPLTAPLATYCALKTAFFRPNDAAAYVAGDVVSDTTGASNFLLFSGAGRGGAVVGGTLTYCHTVTAAFDLLLFDAPPPGAVDNAALALTNVQVGNLVGVLRFLDGQKVNVGTNVEVYRAVGPNNEVAVGPIAHCSADGNLYGQLVTRSAFTPAALTVVAIQLHNLQQAQAR